METGFELDPRLAGDTLFVCDLPLSRVLLMNDSTWPWLILVPRRASAREWMALSREDRHQLDDEMTLASQVVSQWASPDKLNVAALGNVVSQLHVHVVGRFVGDPAWPAPVWGKQAAVPYTEAAAQACIAEIEALFASSQQA